MKSYYSLFCWTVWSAKSSGQPALQQNHSGSVFAYHLECRGQGMMHEFGPTAAAAV